jgi:hypothetical protein
VKCIQVPEHQSLTGHLAGEAIGISRYDDSWLCEVGNMRVSSAAIDNLIRVRVLRNRRCLD